MSLFDFSKPQPVAGSASIEIDLPIEAVYDFVAVNFFHNYPKWAPEVVEFKPINDNPVATGALARQARFEQGHKIESTFEIADLKPNELLTLHGLSDPYRNHYRFERINSAKTRVTFSFELLELERFMRPFEKLIRTAIEEGAQNSLNNIKQLLADASTETPTENP